MVFPIFPNYEINSALHNAFSQDDSYRNGIKILENLINKIE